MMVILVANNIELIENIKNILRNAHKLVFYMRASKTISYPYITFKIESWGDKKTLELDYWTNANDSMGIETIADNVDSILHKYTETNEKHSITMYRNSDRKYIDDEDPSIRRINESYEIRYYGKEE